MPLNVTCPAIDFTTAAILEDGSIQDDFNCFDYIDNHYAVLFFYPLNFTFVCPTEMIALNRAMDAFKARGVKVITVSIDSHFSHLKWQQTPVAEGGIGKVSYVMAGDVSHEICSQYGVKHPEKHVALRSTVIIDPSKNIRYHAMHDLPVGRSMQELLRVIDALQHHENHGEVCPAGWTKGDEAIEENASSVGAYLEKRQAVATAEIA